MAASKKKSSKAKTKSTTKPTTVYKTKNVTINKNRGAARSVSLLNAFKWIAIILLVAIMVLIPLLILKACNDTKINVPWEGRWESKLSIFQHEKVIKIESGKGDPTDPDNPGGDNEDPTKPGTGGEDPDDPNKPGTGGGTGGEDPDNPADPEEPDKITHYVVFHYGTGDVIGIRVAEGEAIGVKMPSRVPKDGEPDEIYCYSRFDYWYLFGNEDQLITSETVMGTEDINAYPHYTPGQKHVHAIRIGEKRTTDDGDTAYDYKCTNCVHVREVVFHTFAPTGGSHVDELGHECTEYECENCHVEFSLVNHTYGENGICTVPNCKHEKCEHAFVDGYCRKCGQYDQQIKTSGDEDPDDPNKPGTGGGTGGEDPDNPGGDNEDPNKPGTGGDVTPGGDEEKDDLNSANNLGFMTWEANTMVSYPVASDLDYAINNLFPPSTFINNDGEKLPNVTVFFDSIVLAHSYNVTVERVYELDGVPVGDKLIAYKVSIESKGILPIDIIKSASLQTHLAGNDFTVRLDRIGGIGRDKLDYWLEISSNEISGDPFFDTFEENCYISVVTHIESNIVDTLNDFSGNLTVLGTNINDVKSVFPIAQILDVVNIDGSYYWQLYLHTNYDYKIEEFTAENAELAQIIPGKTTIFGGIYYLKVNEEADRFEEYVVDVSLYADRNSNVCDAVCFIISKYADPENKETTMTSIISDGELSSYGFDYRIYVDETTGNVVFDYYCTQPRVMSVVFASDIFGQSQIKDSVKTIFAYPFVGFVEVENVGTQYFVVRILRG